MKTTLSFNSMIDLSMTLSHSGLGFWAKPRVTVVPLLRWHLDRNIGPRMSTDRAGIKIDQ
jgi:hypothetical protein